MSSDMDFGPINHNLLAMRLGKKFLWCGEMVRHGASLFYRGAGLRETLRQLKDEVTKGRIVRAVVKEGLLAGYVFIPEYDPARKRIKVAAWTMGGWGSYLFVERPAKKEPSIGEDRNPLIGLDQMRRCERMKQIIADANHAFGYRLMVYGPV